MKRTFVRSFLLFFLFMSVLWTGCSTTKTVYRKIVPSKPVLKKRVMVLPPLDQARLGSSKVEALTEEFITRLEKNGYFLVRKAPKNMSASAKPGSLKFGIYFDPELADRAEEMGIDVLITAIIHPFEVTSEKKGIWPFRRLRRELEVSMSFNAIALTNGTLLLTNLESRKIPIPKTSNDLEVLKIQGQNLGEEDNPASLISEKDFQEAFSDLIKRQASVVTEGLNKNEWSGKILSVEKNGVVINAGSDIGVTTDSVFVVFQQGESVQSPDGRSYHLLGPKIGEIKPGQIMAKTAMAVPVAGKGFKPGQIIEVKR